MLTVQKVSKKFGVETILDNISFTVNAGELLGLIGPNGCGKTTLLRILTGQEQADSGTVRFSPATLQVGYLPQGFEFQPDETLGGYINQCEGDLEGLSKRLQELAITLAQNPSQAGLQREYDLTLARLEHVSQGAGKGMSVLASLGLADVPLEMPVKLLSGGQKTRLALAGVLLSSPRLLILDEPTNHLDLDMLSWLEEWLQDYDGGVLLVSHDRAFLDRVATGMLEINPHTHQIQAYDGNYSDYLETKIAEHEKQWQDYQDQQDEISRLQHAARRWRGAAVKRKGGKGDNSDKFAKGFFNDQTKGVIARAKSLERRLDRLMNEDRVDKPQLSWQMTTDFGDVPTSGRDVLLLEDLSVGYGERVLLNNLNLTVRYGERVALVGPNGSGKTTLLRTVTGQIPALAGYSRLGANVHSGYMTQEQHELDPVLDAFSTIRRQAAFSETDARAFLSQFLFTGDEVFIPVGKLSFGERARLSLACFVARGCNFLILDEPINHLDIPSRARFEQAMQAFQGTALAVVHDRYFIEGFATQIWEVRGGSLRVIQQLQPQSIPD